MILFGGIDYVLFASVVLIIRVCAMDHVLSYLACDPP